MYAEANTLPELDSTQNIIMVRGRENGTHTKIIFKRHLETCDEIHDMKITVSSEISYSFMTSDITMIYHINLSLIGYFQISISLIFP